MAMMKSSAAASPDAYVDALTGWQRDRVEMLRAAIHRSGKFDESIKWTNLLFSANGPCIVIRAEEHRVIIAMFRGKRLRHLDPRIKASGKFELANLILTEATPIMAKEIEQLAAAAWQTNQDHGDPTVRHP